MARWIVAEVAAWVADTPGLGPDVAHLLRVADIDGEALATLSENDMQELGVGPRVIKAAVGIEDAE